MKTLYNSILDDDDKVIKKMHKDAAVMTLMSIFNSVKPKDIDVKQLNKVWNELGLSVPDYYWKKDVNKGYLIDYIRGPKGDHEICHFYHALDRHGNVETCLYINPKNTHSKFLFNKMRKLFPDITPIDFMGDWEFRLI